MGEPIMSIAATESTLPGPAASASRPLHYRFNVAQFCQMLRDETIGPQERVELIDGLVVNKVSKNPPHILVGKLLFSALQGMVPAGWHVTKDDDVVVSDHDQPQPDLAVVRDSPRDYLARYATAAEIALAALISESTLASDRMIKMPRYAAGNIPVYWIVNLIDEQVEVYTNPVGATYADRTVFAHGQDIPVVIDGRLVGRIAVSEILP
jgi:Uma2 family endonuclease